jgi:hypothetical protein
MPMPSVREERTAIDRSQGQREQSRRMIPRPARQPRDTLTFLAAAVRRATCGWRLGAGSLQRRAQCGELCTYLHRQSGTARPSRLPCSASAAPGAEAHCSHGHTRLTVHTVTPTHREPLPLLYKCGERESARAACIVLLLKAHWAAGCENLTGHWSIAGAYPWSPKITRLSVAYHSLYHSG